MRLTSDGAAADGGERAAGKAGARGPAEEGGGRQRERRARGRHWGWWGEAAAGWGGWRRPRLPESRSGWGISGFGMRLCAFADNSGRATAVGVSVSDIQMGQ
jgi:hypothetical protein